MVLPNAVGISRGGEQRKVLDFVFAGAGAGGDGDGGAD